LETFKEKFEGGKVFRGEYWKKTGGTSIWPRTPHLRPREKQVLAKRISYGGLDKNSKKKSNPVNGRRGGPHDGITHCGEKSVCKI